MNELEGFATEFDNQLKQRTLQVRFVESKYLLLYDEAQTLKHRLAMSVLCDVGMEQRWCNGSRDVLGYIDALHSKEVISTTSVRESFHGIFPSFAQCL